MLSGSADSKSGDGTSGQFQAKGAVSPMEETDVIDATGELCRTPRSRSGASTLSRPHCPMVYHFDVKVWWRCACSQLHRHSSAFAACYRGEEL